MPLLASASLAACGVVVTGLALQFLGYWALNLFQQLVVVGMLAGGLFSLFTAKSLLDARPWAAIVGSLLAPLLTLVTTLWAAYAAWNWSFAFYMFLAPPVAAFATLLCPFSIRPSIRSSRARKVFRGSSLLGAIDQ